MGRIGFQFDKSKLPLLLDYYSNFMKNHSKMNDKYQAFKNTEEQFALKNSFLMDALKYQTPDSRAWKNDSQQDMRKFTIINIIDNTGNEDSKFVDSHSSSDSLDKFYDALDEYDKNVYDMIRSTLLLVIL
jgi:hypothetical protein